MICEGAYGHRDYHTVYSNPLLGRIVVGLQSVAPTVRWHTVLEYVFTFTALVLLTYVMVRFSKGYVLAVILQMAMAYEVYVAVQYTKIASLITAQYHLCAL